jgi:type I restriction enzyme S subunit
VVSGVAEQQVPDGYKRTEIGIIPNDWAILNIVEVCSVIDGDRGSNYPSGNDFSDDGYCVFLSATNVTKTGFKFKEVSFISQEKDQLLRKGKLKKGDVVLTTRGSVGHFAYFDGSVSFQNMRINSGMVLLRNESDSVGTDYLYRLLRSFILAQQIERLSFGSAQPQLTVKGINEFLLPFPEQKKEQTAIANALSDVDGLITSLEKLITKKRAIKTAAMQQLLTGKKRLPPFDQIHTGYKQTELGEIPEDWEINNFADIAAPKNSRINPKVTGGKEFCIELEHVDQGTGTVNGSSLTTSESSLKNVFTEGDILFGKLRSYLRKYWRADRSGVCSTEIWVLKANEQRAIPPFIFQTVQTDDFIDCTSESYGTHMPRSDWKIVKFFLVATPSIDEQISIASVLSDMDQEIIALSNRLNKTQKLKQGMMQELLTGRTRLI